MDSGGGGDSVDESSSLSLLALSHEERESTLSSSLFLFSTSLFPSSGDILFFGAMTLVHTVQRSLFMGDKIIQ